MPKLTLLVGPPGSGKSTYATDLPYSYVNQDTQGKKGHWEAFEIILEVQNDVVVDRMNFNKAQRLKYLEAAKAAGYETHIVVLHQPYAVCLQRCLRRENHPTITNEEHARSALDTFFSKYERPTEDEADSIEFVYPEGVKLDAVICDLDGTLCNIDHRLHFVRGEGRKDWKSFFEHLDKDSVHKWCASILLHFSCTKSIVLASGRPDSYLPQTKAWLNHHQIEYNALFMRHRRDSRQDYIAKEIILDFEVLTRYRPLFFIDDRQQVVDMWRRRGFVALQCARGDF